MRRTIAALPTVLALCAPLAAPLAALAQTPANPAPEPDASPMILQPVPSERPIADPVPVAPGTDVDARALETLQPTIPAAPGPPGTGRIPTDAPASFLPEGTRQGPPVDTPVPGSLPGGITLAEAAAWADLPVLSVEGEPVGTVRDLLAREPGGTVERIVVARSAGPGGLVAVPVEEIDTLHPSRALRLRLSTAEIAGKQPFAYGEDEAHALIGGRPE